MEPFNELTEASAGETSDCQDNNTNVEQENSSAPKAGQEHTQPGPCDESQCEQHANKARSGISERKKAANRLNAQKSTGPRTAQGKNHSKRNALQHGLLAKTVVVKTDGRPESEAYLALLKQLHEECRHEDLATQISNELLLVSYWKNVKGNEYLRALFERRGPVSFQTFEIPNLLRYLSANEKALHSYLKDLKERSSLPAEEDDELAAADEAGDASAEAEKTRFEPGYREQGVTDGTAESTDSAFCDSVPSRDPIQDFTGPSPALEHQPSVIAESTEDPGNLMRVEQAAPMLEIASNDPTDPRQETETDGSEAEVVATGSALVQ